FLPNRSETADDDIGLVIDLLLKPVTEIADDELRTIVIAAIEPVATHRRLAGGAEEALLLCQVLALRRALPFANGFFLRSLVLGRANDRRIRTVVHIAVGEVNPQAVPLGFMFQPHP